MDNVVTLDPAYFWYTLFMIMSSALIWIIRTYIVRTTKILDNIVITINEISTMVKLHENEIKNQKEDVIELKNDLRELKSALK